LPDASLKLRQLSLLDWEFLLQALMLPKSCRSVGAIVGKQIGLIQGHLKEEAEKFRRGDFSDPARIHGHDMAGLAELKTGFRQIDIQYRPLSNGGEIRYVTTNPNLVMAIHRWFMAQVSDHGHHAMDH
jgi:hypothetical protein